MTENLSPRQLAAKNGERKYSTGLACRNGHVAERYTLSGTCVECLNESRAKMASTFAANSDPLRDERHRFGRETMVIKSLAPLRDLEGLRTLEEAMLASRFPTLVGHVPMRSPIVSTGSDGTVALHRFVTHTDDASVMRSLCTAAIERLTPEVAPHG